MKRIGILLLGATVALAGAVLARDLETVKKSGTIIIGTEGAFPPFNYFEGKTLTGFEVDLGNAIAKQMGLKAEWKTLSFDALLPALNQDRFDFVIASHGITAERAKAVDFSNPHYCTGGVIVKRPGGPTTAADLKGKKIAVQVGTTYLQNVQKLPGINANDIKTFPKDTDALQNLIGGRVDAWVTDKFVALDAIKANKNAKLQQGDMVFQEKIAMAVKKGNSSLLGALNDALAAIQKDGTYKKISEKWFGEDVRCK